MERTKLINQAQTDIKELLGILNNYEKKQSELLDIIDVLDSRLLSKVLERKNFTDYLFKYGNNQALLTQLHTFKNWLLGWIW